VIGKMSRPVFRFAPSPNGQLHLGHALSALLNRDLAREAGGRFLVRIEDIDPGRSMPSFEAQILDDLAWLGLDWEKPVRRQSEHLSSHERALDELNRRGLLYPCFCTRGSIKASLPDDAPADPDGAPIYPGTCRDLTAGERARHIRNGDLYVLRLNMQKALNEIGGPLTWIELDKNGRETDIAADPAAWGDVVLARREVRTSYHLAVVLDDAEQGVTHVVRGKDLFHATSVHRVLQTLLGIPAPVYHHHRLILDKAGKKLSKSEGAESLRTLRSTGTAPADIRRLIGA
jgi:glutamyl-Q tRNA(Asp) synthetase